jgi:uncharacterized membrane protein
MASLSQAKILGGVGSILVLVGGLGSLGIPYLGTALPIIGLIMTIIAVKYISDIVQDSSIFRNIMIGLGVAIVGSIVLGVFLVEAFLGAGGMTGLAGGITAPTTTGGAPTFSGSFLRFVGIVVAGFAILWILLIFSSIFVRKSYNTVATKLNIGLFRTAALIYLIGAILTIIFVGLIIVLVAQILLIIAFFSIPDTFSYAQSPETTFYPPPFSPSQPAASAPPSQPSAFSGRSCPRCGAPVAQDSLFCPSCGSSLSQ